MLALSLHGLKYFALSNTFFLLAPGAEGFSQHLVPVVTGWSPAEYLWLKGWHPPSKLLVNSVELTKGLVLPSLHS